MALVTQLPARRSTVSTAALTPHHLATISMLHSRGHITERDAARLSVRPNMLDDLVILALLHERRDLTDIEYELEKGERLHRT
jgi:hypothetical protein